MESNAQNFWFGIATNLASDLLKAGFKHLTTLALGDDETRAHQKLWEHTFSNFAEELFSAMNQDLALEMANVFSYFVYEPNVAETLIDWALTNKEPDLNLLQDAFQQAGFDTLSIPMDFGYLITSLKKHLYNQLNNEASRFESPLSNRVNTTRIADIQKKVELALTYMRQRQASQNSESAFQSENIRLPYFFGRKREIEKLTGLLLSESPKAVAITALQGMGGVGKTVLARKIAHELSNKFPGGVLWADFPSNQGNPLSILTSWALLCNRPDLVELPSDEIRAQAVQRAIASHTQKYGNVLVVFDDVRETEADPWLKGAHLLMKAIPQNTPLIITTRQTEVALSLRAETMPLDVMETNDALEFVLFSLPYISKDTGLRLIKLVGNLPLAIEIAISLVKIEGIDWVINSLEDPLSRLSLFELQDNLKDDNIWSSFSISYDSLDQETASLFRLLGVFTEGKIRKEWILGIFTKTTFNAIMPETTKRLIDRSLRNLRYHSLIKWADKDKEVYQLHPLLIDYSKMLLRRNGEMDKASIAHCQYFLEFTEAKLDDFESMEKTIENIMQATRYSYQVKAWKEVCLFTERLAIFGNFLHKRGLWKNALELLSYAKEASKEISDLKLNASFLCDMGIYERESGNYSIAKDLLEQSIIVSKSNNDIYTLSRALSNLGMILVYRRQNEDAMNCFDEAISNSEMSGNFTSLGQAILGVGRIALSQGDTAMAKEKIMRSIEILKDTKSRQLYIFALRAYGEVLSVERNYDDALSFYNKALDESIKTNDIQAQAYTLRGIGDTYRYMNKSKTALSYYSKSEQLYRDVGDKAALAGALCCIGEVYFENENFGKAELFFSDGFSFSSEPRWKARNQFGLAKIKYQKGDKLTAYKLAKQAHKELDEIGHRDAILIKSWIETNEQ